MTHVRRLTSGAAAVLVAIALLAALRQLPRSIRTVRDRAAFNAGTTLRERELAPARWWRLNEPLLLQAEKLVPRNAVYSVAVGRRQAATGAPLFYGYWLLPRRRSKDPRAARWVVLWGTPRSRLGVRTRVVADLGRKGEILRVAR